jgi:arylsulfatase A-like enzyme
MKRLLCAATAALALARLTAPGVCGTSGVESGGVAREGRPNILLIVLDDVGWGQVGYQGGHVATTNIDRIAREGVRLEQFYVQPACSATRSSLLTGRHPLRTGTQENISARDTGGLLEDERTLADALGEAGYATAIVGKWHLGHWKKKHLPMQRGFDHQYGHYNSFIDYYTHRRELLDWHRNEEPLIEEGYSTFLIAREAVRLIGQLDDARPWLLYVAFNAVHDPPKAPEEIIEGYRGKDRWPVHAAALHCADLAIGEILTALASAGMQDETIVIFLSDNGAPVSRGNPPLRGGKFTYYEGGIRVPALIWWPGHLEGGRAVRAPLHVVDLYPTLLKLAGASLAQPLPLDGEDVWTTLRGGEPDPDREILLGPRVIRGGAWKLIDRDSEAYGRKAWSSQLYDLEQDPSEAHNLASRLPGKVAELRLRLDAYAGQARPVPASPRMPPDARVYGELENLAWEEP